MDPEDTIVTLQGLWGLVTFQKEKKILTERELNT